MNGPIWKEIFDVEKGEINDGSFEIQDMVSGDICNW